MTLLKIIRLMLERLRNEEHFQFMSDVLQILSAGLASKVGNLTVNIDTLFSMFKKLLKREDIAVAYLKKSGLTSPIAKADGFRDMIYRGLALYVQAYEHNADADMRDAAQRIQVLIDNYGDVRHKSYNEETATIYNFLEDLNNKLSEQVNTIKLNDWISDLENANTSFEKLMEDRREEGIGSNEDIRVVRSEIDSVYRDIVNLIEIEHKISKGTQYVDLIERINELVKYSKTVLAQRKGRADAGNDEDIIEEWE